MDNKRIRIESSKPILLDSSEKLPEAPYLLTEKEVEDLAEQIKNHPTTDDNDKICYGLNICVQSNDNVPSNVISDFKEDPDFGTAAETVLHPTRSDIQKDLPQRLQKYDDEFECILVKLEDVCKTKHGIDLWKSDASNANLNLAKTRKEECLFAKIHNTLVLEAGENTNLSTDTTKQVEKVITSSNLDSGEKQDTTEQSLPEAFHLLDLEEINAVAAKVRTLVAKEGAFKDTILSGAQICEFKTEILPDYFKEVIAGKTYVENGKKFKLPVQAVLDEKAGNSSKGQECLKELDIILEKLFDICKKKYGIEVKISNVPERRDIQMKSLRAALICEKMDKKCDVPH